MTDEEASPEAWNTYVRLLNQDRQHIQLIPEPYGERYIGNKMPTKWAVLLVLSKRAWLSIDNIKELLGEMGYLRKETALRTALKRLVKFGLAVRQPFYKFYGVRLPGTYGWRLTERGRQVPFNGHKNTMTLQQKIEDSLVGKTSWMFAADIATELQLNKTVVSSTLRKLYAKNKVVRQIVAGHNPRIWAHKDNFNNPNVVLTMPALPPKAAPKRKKKATTASAAVATPTSGTRNRTMCLPNKPTFVKSVTGVVDIFVSKQKTFSAHDVTKELRTFYNDLYKARKAGTIITVSGELDPAETGTVWVDGLDVPKIDHEDVKEVMGHLFNTGVMVGYDRKHNGTYLEYFKQNVVPAIDPSTTADPDPDPLAPRVSSLSSPYDGSSTI